MPFEFECPECSVGSGIKTGDLQEELHRLVHIEGWKIKDDGEFVCFACRVSAMIDYLEQLNVIAAAGN